MTDKPMNPKKNRRLLSDEEKARAHRLKAIWDAKKKELGVTQASVALSLGWDNNTAVGQYLNGRIPLNIEAAFKFAAVLGVPPTEFWPDIFSGKLPPAIAKTIEMMFLMSPSQQDSTVRFAAFELHQVNDRKAS
ncbi:MAG: helix-turn-helix domain-containing protein [Hyphomicrobiaceae bacterium]